MNQQKTKKCIKRSGSVLPQLWTLSFKIKKTGNKKVMNKENLPNLPSNPKINKPTQGKSMKSGA
jgi:hypothetical protein